MERHLELLNQLTKKLNEDNFTKLNLVELSKRCSNQGYIPRALIDLGILAKQGKNSYIILKSFDPSSRIVAKSIMDKTTALALEYREKRKSKPKPKRSFFKKKPKKKGKSGVSFSILWGLFKFEKK